ncbi:MAG: hypothetical protein Q9159_003616 [Coniocarpon cinnabarinum]
MAGESGSRAGTVIGVNVAFLVTAFLFTVTRFLTRIFIVRDFGPEDWTIGLAIALSIGMTICMGEQVRYGLGQHFHTLPREEYINSLKPFWASVWLYNMTLSLTKISILCQYYRIFIYKRTRIAVWVTLVIVICYGIATFFDSIFICTPVNAFWSPDPVEAKKSCVNENMLWYSNSAVNIVLDVVIIALPMPAIQTLSISSARKVAVMGLFALGGFVTVTSIVRLYTLRQIADSTDVTWDNVNAAVWSVIEANTGIICACLPAIRPLFACLFGNRPVATPSHYRIPDESGHEIPLSATVHHSSRSIKQSANDSAPVNIFGDQPTSDSGAGKANFLISTTRSEARSENS